MSKRLSTFLEAVYLSPSNKYRLAQEVARREGLRFVGNKPPGHVLYAGMKLLGYRWVSQSQEWQRWRKPYVILQEAS